MTGHKKPPILLLYDGHCSVCVGTARTVERLDNGRGRIRTVDFRTSTAEADQAGITPERLETSLHTVHPDGRVSRGPEAVREAMRAVRLGAFARVLGWPIIGHVFGACYDVFARNRLNWFGTDPTECGTGACGIEPASPPGDQK